MATVLALNGLKVEVRAETTGAKPKYRKTIVVTVTSTCSIGFDPRIVERDENGVQGFLDTNLTNGGNPNYTVSNDDRDVPTGKKAVPKTVTPQIGGPGIQGNKDTGWVILAGTTFTYENVNILEDA